MTDTLGVLYARYSPRPKDFDAIGKQMDDMVSWCAANAVAEKCRFSDPDVSGTISLWHRPGLRNAIEALQPGWVLVVRNLNRIARKASVALVIEEEVWDVRQALLASVEDGGILDNDPHSRFTRLVLYGVSELQRIEGNQRTSRRMRQEIHENGRRLSSQAPYGLRFDGEVLARDEYEQEVILRVRDLRQHGIGYRNVARLLNLDGYVMRSGGAWTSAGIGRVVRNL